MKRTAGQFEILEILGEGSFGTVCVARVTSDPLRRRVALKILKGAYASNKKILNRTRDEAKLLSAINHPNIVRVERLMEINGRPCVVMEHVQGVSLDQLLLRFKDGLPAAVAIEMVRHTCLALHAAYAEAHGDDGRPLKVIHRDIKPSNIMLSIHGEVKVLDFGIARGEFEGREARTESVVMGSRPYMAPERLDGISDSPSVDVYSAGMSLFELLTGRTMSLSINPISHDQAMSRQLQYIQVPGMSQAALEDLRDLIRRMCAYTRDYRPGSAEVARDLEQLVYAIDRRFHIQLEEFARTTVLPIYETRPRVSPEEAFQHIEDGAEFFKEVTGAQSQSTPSDKVPSERPSWVPYVFVGGIGFAVMVLLLLAVTKSLWWGVKESVALDAPDDGKVRLELWIPEGARAQVGDVFLSAKGAARVQAGTTLLEITLADGRLLHCSFVAADGEQVRLVPGDAITVDDGDTLPCQVVHE